MRFSCRNILVAEGHNCRRYRPGPRPSTNGPAAAAATRPSCVSTLPSSDELFAEPAAIKSYCSTGIDLADYRKVFVVRCRASRPSPEKRLADGLFHSYLLSVLLRALKGDDLLQPLALSLLQIMKFCKQFCFSSASQRLTRRDSVRAADSHGFPHLRF